MTVPLSILIPAHDEESYIVACLGALLRSDLVKSPVEVIVIANGCTDKTVALAKAHKGQFEIKEWDFSVLDLSQGDKLGALNAGEAAARHGALAYLDADVLVSEQLVSQLAEALDTDAPRYASGTPVIARAFSLVTQAYARFWQTLPFVTDGVPGFGIFAVNAAGRARWGDFPDIISDDTFVRLQFAPHERIKVAATYNWPMIEGFWSLVRVRRRQNRGVAEVEARFPELVSNNDPAPSNAPPMWKRLVRDPVAFGTYAAVTLATRLPQDSDGKWVRGR